MFSRAIELLIETWDDAKFIIFIPEFKEGVLLRAGRFKKTLGPGWHFKVPFIDDYFTDSVKTDTMKTDEVSLTTADGKTITVRAEFELRIIDIHKAVIETNDWRSNLQDVAQGIISSILEDLTWEDIMKKSTKTSISKKIKESAFSMGIETKNFNFTDKSISRSFRLFTSNINVG